MFEFFFHFTGTAAFVVYVVGHFRVAFGRESVDSQPETTGGGTGKPEVAGSGSGRPETTGGGTGHA